MTKLYRVRWGKLEEYDVQRETPKTVKATMTEKYGNYTHTIRRDQIGTEYHESARSAWVSEVMRLNDSISYTKEKLQQLRTAHGMAQSEAGKS